MLNPEMKLHVPLYVTWYLLCGAKSLRSRSAFIHDPKMCRSLLRRRIYSGQVSVQHPAPPHYTTLSCQDSVLVYHDYSEIKSEGVCPPVFSSSFPLLYELL